MMGGRHAASILPTDAAEGTKNSELPGENLRPFLQ